MKCLVLGGGGFIGQNLSHALVAAGHHIRVFERPRLATDDAGGPLAVVSRGVEWIEGDFANRADVDAAVQGCEVVFHLICTTLPGSSNENPIYDVESNVVPTLGLLEAARTHKVKKIIFISSGGTVYGAPVQTPIPESHVTQPICSYGITKVTIERYLSLYRYLHGLDYCVLRVSNPFGEHQRPASSQGVVAAFLHRAMKHQPIEIWGDGSVVRDYVYVADVVSAFLKAMDYGGDVRTFNVGSGRGCSLNDLAAEIEAVVGHRLERVYRPSRRVDVPVNVLDVATARTVLKWMPATSLKAGLERVHRWMLESSGDVR